MGPTDRSIAGSWVDASLGRSLVSRIQLFGIEIDALRMEEAVARVLEMTERHDGLCRYVVTPNIDHTLLLRESEALRLAYGNAALVLADGAPVVGASRLLGRPLPERVAGSDLVPAVFAAAVGRRRPLRVYWLGAAPGVAERAARAIAEAYPSVMSVGEYSPPIGFERSSEERRRILDRIATASPDIVLVGLGAPKQEVFVHEHQGALAAPVALCVGATIDFLAGVKARAPVWMRRAGLEWLHRAASEPRRLAGRYARDAWWFPQLVWREWRGPPSSEPSVRRARSSAASPPR